VSSRHAAVALNIKESYITRNAHLVYFGILEKCMKLRGYMTSVEVIPRFRVFADKVADSRILQHLDH
jgi:hypothetical protein